MTDEFLDRVFELFFDDLGLPNLMRKTDYHVLARHVAPDEIDPEVVSVLDDIARIAGEGHPREN